ncbi:MAG TPA: signal peptidase I [Coleofasciculaceae cyanobacterium]
MPKNPWFAVNLSMFFPGIGQLYAGETLKGIGFIVSGVVLIAIAAWSIFSATGNTVTGLICLLLFAIAYLFNLFDAYVCIHQSMPMQGAEKIPRTNKDPWFAVLLSRILPGLGQLYTGQALVGAVFLSFIIICSSLNGIFSNLFLFPPIISAVACYHVFVTFPRKNTQHYPIIAVLAGGILALGLVISYLPSWIQQEVELFEIPSKSMLPTLQVGDRIFVNISSDYSPKQGDVIVFIEPESAKLLDAERETEKERFFVKRVVGEPGQEIRIADGVVTINNQPLQEGYIAESLGYQWGPTLVPEDSYFVLGDNRNNSFDSHVWGFLPKQNIIGQAYKVYWPPERIQSLIE